jgi:hypothetical protein
MTNEVAEAILTASSAYPYPAEIQALFLLVRSQQELLKGLMGRVEILEQQQITENERNTLAQLFAAVFGFIIPDQPGLKKRVENLEKAFTPNGQ